MAWGEADSFLISMNSSLPPVGPRNETFSITTVVDAACAAGAASASAASAAVRPWPKRRGFTIWESFPQGNPYDGWNLSRRAALT